MSKDFSPSGFFFKSLSFLLVFCSLNIICVVVVLLHSLLCVLWPLIWSLVSVTNFGKFSVVVASNISYVLFFVYLLVFLLHVSYNSYNCPTILRYLFLFFGLFSLCFQLGIFLFTYLHILYCWSFPQLFLLMSHQRHSSFLLQTFYS